MKPSLRNLFMKKLTRNTRSSDHFREYLLTDLGQNGLWRVVFTEVCKRSTGASRFSLELKRWSTKSSSTRLFEEIRHEPSGKGWLRLQHSEHLLSCDAQDLTLRQRCSGGQSARLTVQTAFAEETASFQQCDDGLFTALGDDGQLEPAVVNKEHGVRRVPSSENDFTLVALDEGLPVPTLDKNSVESKSFRPIATPALRLGE